MSRNFLEDDALKGKATLYFPIFCSLDSGQSF